LTSSTIQPAGKADAESVRFDARAANRCWRTRSDDHDMRGLRQGLKYVAEIARWIRRTGGRICRRAILLYGLWALFREIVFSATSACEILESDGRF